MHIDYPLEVCGGIRTLVTSDLFRDTLCPVSVNANRLKTEDQWPLNDYIAFDIFMNIFRLGICLTNLEYRIPTGLGVSEYFDKIIRCNSLKILGVCEEDTQEDIWTIFSKCFPQLTRVDIRPSSLKKRSIYRVSMLESNFE